MYRCLPDIFRRESLDYRCEDRKKAVGELKDEIGAINLIPPKKRTVHSRDAFEDTAFKPGFEIVKF